MKLELKHIAPYLPYKLMMMTPKHRFNYGDQESLLLTGISNYLDEDIYEFLRYDDLEFSNTMKWVKPMLRNISQYCNNVTGRSVMDALKCDLSSVHELWEFNEYGFINDITYKTYEVMCRNHIDFQGLIKAGLAIDINETL